jgi:oligopeptide transport system substrate-binding protein
MKKICNLFTLASASIILVLTSCNEGSKKNNNIEESKGGIFYGGIIRLNEVESFKTLNPTAVNELSSAHIGSQIFEGLVKFSQKDLSTNLALAKKIESNQDQTEWTFHIRQGVKFHDDVCFPEGKGRFVNAKDVKYCFDRLCIADPNNLQFGITFKDRVVGANEAYELSKTGKKINVSGIKVRNDSTVVISLSVPFPGFLNILAMPGCWIYPKEAVDKYGVDIRTHSVGTGPFYLETIKEGEVVILKKNQNYYGVDSFGNKLPYLDGIKYSFINEKKVEVLEFKSGNLDMIYRLPVEIFHEIMGDLEHASERKIDFQILNSTALNTVYLGFNCTSPLFSKKEVRLAFNYAIDRKKIANFTIQGEGVSADYGIVPFFAIFKKDGYAYDQLRGYTLDVPKAKNLLKLAGYPDGKGFPSIVLQVNGGGGDKNKLVAEVIQKMLKENLNIDIEVTIVPLSEHVEQISNNKADFFRLGWSADYQDPETFLTLFYGKHLPKNPSEKAFINYFRFKNDRFDSLFLASFKEINKEKRYKLLSQAEQIILDEAPFMPLYYDENFRLEQLNVRNFPENAMNFFDLTEVFLVPKDKISKK